MKILVPLNDMSFLKKYIKAGADEFYIGFYDNAWEEKFGKYADINRMSGFKDRANKYNFIQMIDVVKNIKQMGKDVFITMNANVYSDEQINYISEMYFPKIKESAADGLIISDMELGRKTVKYGINAVASTLCTVYNSDIALEYEKEGIKRLIIPRDVSLNEIEKMSLATPNIDYEVFFMRNGCVFSDGYCLGTHRPECGSTCRLLQTINKETITSFASFDDRHSIEVNDFLYNTSFHRDACGMCALYRLKKARVGSLKIVGRVDLCDLVCKDIELTKTNLEILDSCSTEEEFLANMRFPDNSISKCKMGFSCYYPEVRF